MSTATTDAIAPIHTSTQSTDRRTKPRGYVRIDRRRNDRLAMSEAAVKAHVEDWLNGRAPLVTPAGNSSIFYQGLKRTPDIIGALVLLVIFGPIMAVTWIVLTITTRGKAVFVQDRVGLCGRRFKMYKFRTMVLDAQAKQHLVANQHATGPIFKNRRDPRITPFGRWLRSFSIDEMPQLVNILKGDMSLVGPRPPVPGEVAKYQPWQWQRLAVKPGLTCLWQVSGRSEVGFEDWVRMDLWYLEHQNLVSDVNLLVRTPLSVLSRKGAY